MGGGPQPDSHGGEVAVYHRRCSHQARASLSVSRAGPIHSDPNLDYRKRSRGASRFDGLPAPFMKLPESEFQ